jgi:predicted DNA-binding transcriptional regulator AlpA
MTKDERNGGSQYLTPKGVALLLQCSLKTVYNRTKQGILRRHSLGGRRVYYLRLEVETSMFPLD